MRDRIVIIGGGTAGTLMANRLRRRLGDAAQLVVLDRDDHHLYQPGLLFVPFAKADPQRLVRSRRAQLHRDVEFRIAEVERVETASSTVHLQTGEKLPYDILVLASGATLQPGETEGLTGPGWGETVLTFYDLDGAVALRERLAALRGGRLVVNPIELPIKCPVAPLEFCFLADWYLRERGVRQDVELVYATNLDSAFTKPICSAELGGLLERKQIRMETEFAAGRVDGEHGTLTSWDEREIEFDLLVTIPLHGGAPYVQRSPELGDELGFVRTDRKTLRAKAAENVFAIGDATDVPTSKAGSVSHFEAETVVENICRTLAGEGLAESFDGHANCFIETGFHKALLVDFNYDVEPLPGRYPLPVLGPLPLLRESRRNHLAKLAFEWVYWNVLLPGRALPGIGSELRLAGKDTHPIARRATQATTEGRSR